MTKKTQLEQDELRRRLAHAIELDQLMHQAMPPGGNANIERAQVLVGDQIRELKKELGE